MIDRPAPWRDDVLARLEQRERAARHPFARLISGLYRVAPLRESIRKLCLRLEGGAMFSTTWRELLAHHHAVHVGPYSYGDIMKPGLLPAGTSVGNYCSVGSGLIVRRRNHPTERPILHPFFYNSRLGLLTEDTIPDDSDNPLTIGHDVWIADRVIILAGCRQIGNGAVIAAGSVVTRDVPAYSIVAGVPARPVRMRFDADRVSEIEASRWWDRPIAELVADPPFTGILGQPSDTWSRSGR